MDRICRSCGAHIASETVADWCPACGGALIDGPSSPGADSPAQAKPEVDRRGIILPRRHAVGGIITPQ